MVFATGMHPVTDYKKRPLRIRNPLGFYAAKSGSFVSTFRDNQSGLIFRGQAVQIWYETTNLRCVKPQKSAGLIYTGEAET